MKDYFLVSTKKINFFSDSLVWKSIFLKPVGFTSKYGGYAELNLSEYFEYRECLITADGHHEKRKLILSKEKYLFCSEMERNFVFLSMSNFLLKFNKPLTHCYIRVPNHRDVEPIKDFLPLGIRYDKPSFLSKNDSDDMLNVLFEYNLFCKLHEYIFGFRFTEEDKELYNAFVLSFSPECLSGFLLY